MTSTEIATIEKPEVIDAEVIPPLNKTDARRLDKKVRSSCDRINTGMEKVGDEFGVLAELLDQASNGNIHEALGLASWTVWFKDAVQIRASDRAERKMMASLMSGKQMSQRAIADVLGVSQKTIDRDLEGEEFDTNEVITTDGKTAPRTKPAKDDEPESPPAPTHSEPSVAECFKTELYQLQNDVEAFKEVLEDERFPKARARLAKLKIIDDYRQCINDLDDILVTIVGEETE